MLRFGESNKTKIEAIGASLKLGEVTTITQPVIINTTVKYHQSAHLARVPHLDFTAKGRKSYGRVLLSLYGVRTSVH